LLLLDRVVDLVEEGIDTGIRIGERRIRRSLRCLGCVRGCGLRTLSAAVVVRGKTTVRSAAQLAKSIPEPPTSDSCIAAAFFLWGRLEAAALKPASLLEMWW
jgi:hypothetical protein